MNMAVPFEVWRGRESPARNLGEAPMDPSIDRGPGRFLGGLSRKARWAAAMAAVLAVVGGAIAVTVVIPRAGGVGAGPTEESSIPVTPRAPDGWHLESSFGAAGMSGGMNLLRPAPRMAVHVSCTGFDELAVLASTEGSDTPSDRPLQAALFRCSGEERVVLVAATGQFQGVRAVLVPGPGSIANSSYVVSIEVPDETPEPSASR